MKNLWLSITLCFFICPLIAHAQHKEDKVTPQTNTDSINTNNKRFIIDIYDTTNPNAKKTMAHERLCCYLSIKKDVAKIVYENYITRNFDTLYPDLPLKDSLIAPFAEYLLDRILKGKLNAYPLLFSENEIIKPLSATEALEGYIAWPDINYIEDPANREEPTSIIGRDMSLGSYTQLDIIAHKVRNSQGGKMSCTITAIAPMKMIYGDDGQYRGSTAIYWIKYEDVKDIITSYEKLHKECIISKGIQDILDGKGTERHFE